jgi:multicomponent Na+:H+ antiporter subunit C
MSGGVFLIFIAVGMRNAAEIPDPVPHAMVLTGIVVSVSATGLALALLDRWQAISGRTELTREKDPDAS